MSNPTIARMRSRAGSYVKGMAWLMLITFALPTSTAEAQTRRTWSGAASTLWSTGANWFGGSAPATTDAVVFDSTGTFATGTSMTFTSNVTTSGIVLTNPSSDVVISGTSNNMTFTIDGLGIDMSAAQKNLSIFATSIVQFRSGTINVAAGRTLSINYTNAGNAAAFVNGTTTINGQGLVSYAGGAYVGRSGTTNTALFINSGTLQLGTVLQIANTNGTQSTTHLTQLSNASIVGGIAVGNGGSFVQSSGTTTMNYMTNAAWTGTSSITINGGIFNQTTNWAGSNGVAHIANDRVTLTFAGGTSTLYAPSATRGAGAVLNVNFNGGVFRPAANSSNFFGNAANLYVGNNAALIDTNGFNLTFAQTMMNGTAAGTNGSLNKLGSGTFTLSASNSFTGNTRINAGALSLGHASALAGSTLDMNSGDGGSLVFGLSGTNTYNLGGLIGSRNIATSGSVVMSVGGNGTSGTYSGVISGGGAFTKVGSGTLAVANTNTYTGTTNVNAGVLQIGAGGSAGGLATTSAITGSTGAVLAFNRSDAIAQGTAFANAISGGISVSQIGSGTVTLAAGNTYTGPTTVSNGMLALGAADAIASQSDVVVNGGVLNLGTFTDTVSSFTIASGSLTGSTGNKLTAATYGLGGGTVAGNLGAGTLNVTANSALTGASDATAVNLNAGTLTLGSANRFTSSSVAVTGSSSAGLSLGGNETFGSLAGFANVALGGFTLTTGSGGSTSYSGILSGAGGLTKVGSGTFTLLGANSYGGATQVNAGVLSLGASDVLSGSTAVTVAGGELRMSGNSDTVGSFAITSGSLTSSSGKLTATTYGLGGGTVAGNLGAGTLNVTANSALNGTSDATAVNLNAGALTLGSGGNRFTSASVAVTGSSGASLTLGGNETFGSLAGFANVALGGFTLSTGSGGSTSYSGILSGSGGLTKVGGGTFTLTGNNTFSGLTTISGGTLSVGDGGTSGGLAGDVVNNAAVIFNRYDDTTFAGGISGSGGLTKLGAGKLTLTGSNSFAGPTTLTAGALAVNGQIASGVAVASGATIGGSGLIGGVLSGDGVVSPGNSPGILTAGQFNAIGGLDAAFEFRGLSPVYNASSASVNDVLRLTNGSPFIGSLTLDNVIDIYFDVDSIGSGPYEGGFFTTLSAADLLMAVQGAKFNYWIKDSGGGQSFNGVNYSAYSGVTLTTASATRDFGSGNVVGSVTQFIVVPEPEGIALAGIGAAIASWAAARSRRRAS